VRAGVTLLAAMALLAGGPAASSTAATTGSKPSISARSAVLVDARDGHVLYAHRSRTRRPIASTTKLMTALITLQQFPRLGHRLAAAPYKAGPAESRINLRPGERLAVRDLLLALLLESANDAAETLARGSTGSVRSFVARMNERAERLGLRDTHYANPVGIDDPANYSSAMDLSLLARTLLKNKTFATIVDLPSARLRTGARPRIVSNRNRLVATVPWVDGVKTGHTQQAGYVLVGSGTRKGVHLVSVVMGAPSESQRDADTLALLRYGFSRYHVARPVKAGMPLTRAKVEYFGDRKVPLVARQGVKVPLRRGQRARTVVDAPEELKGPIPAGTRVGSVSVFKEGQRVRVLPLETGEAVPEAGFLRRLVHSPVFWFFLLGSVALLALAARRRAARRRRRREARKSGNRARRVVT
jgi:serine-type D-Ala-D-Ala carboxypeptidase (penicillin-binding protein 5/6)